MAWITAVCWLGKRALKQCPMRSAVGKICSRNLSSMGRIERGSLLEKGREGIGKRGTVMLVLAGKDTLVTLSKMVRCGCVYETFEVKDSLKHFLCFCLVRGRYIVAGVVARYIIGRTDEY